MNSLLKGLAERALVASGVVPFARSRRAGGAIVLAYHNIVPHGEPVMGDRSLHLPQRSFAAQLDTLGRTHDVITLRDALGPARPSRRPAVVITFDDAYAGAIDTGLAELTRRGMPATVFVAPALLGGSNWWDLLAPATGMLDDATRNHALKALRGNGADILSWAARSGIRLNESLHVPRLATISQVKAALLESGIDLQSHSWSHQNLAALGGAELQAELTLPREWLSKECGIQSSYIAYPYGLHSPAVDRAAAATGYDAGLRVEGGWLPRRNADDVREFALPRFNVPANMTLDGFRIRLAGIAATG